MEHHHTITLRPLQDGDQEIIAQLANNKKIWDHLRDFFPHPYHVSHAESFIQSTLHVTPQVTFGILYDGQLCGVIGLIPGTDIYQKNAEIGYWIGELYWGKGIATEAVRQITRYGFDQLQFVRIFAGVLEHNKASMRVLEHNGFELEAIFKKGIFKNGVIMDEYRYAKIR